jgi:acyl-CoA synthetase (AMP-forming)/AMP-acid ligase II
MTAYENNPVANAQAFCNGWFRTGDQGQLDEAGYLRISGRLKEIINRGGEKVSPPEVDAVLLTHPAVDQAVTFGIPHSQLGEEVAAAVVLHEGMMLDEVSLREFVNARLASFKVPRRVVFLKRIPTGATGKVQRVGLAKTLGFC